MDEIRLIKPTMEYAEDIMKYRQEFLDSGDSLDGCGNLKMCLSADEWIRTIDILENEETCPEDRVSSNTFIAVRTADKR